MLSEITQPWVPGVSWYAGGAREQSLALIRGLAAQIGSSGLVLEVLGGVCARFAQEDGPRTNAMACFAAALQGSSKVLTFPQHSSIVCIDDPLTLQRKLKVKICCLLWQQLFMNMLSSLLLCFSGCAGYTMEIGRARKKIQADMVLLQSPRNTMRL